MATNEQYPEEMDHEEEDVMLDEAEAEEVIPEDEDAAMDSDNDDDQNETLEEIQLVNDSIAHFDAHKDSIFTITQHPIHPQIVATGGGDNVGYVFDASATSSTQQTGERDSLRPGFKLDGHKESINAITFTQPRGEYLVAADLVGQIRVWRDTSRDQSGRVWQFLAEAQEVEEINFLVACPHPSYPNTVALGASDGSVWVYTINGDDASSPLTIVQAFYLHTESCTAGAWTPDGKLLATVAEDGSFYVWDVFGDAAAAGVVDAQGSQTVVSLTGADERFKVDGGLYTVTISPNGTMAAIGGAGGYIHIIGLPRLAEAPPTGKGGAGSRGKAGSGRPAAGSPGAGQAGQILASLKVQEDSVETIAFSPPPLTLMAAGSVDGSICLFDSAHRFIMRRHIRDAHDEEAVIKVDFVTGDPNSGGWVLTSCGNDGVVKRWDTRGGTAAASHGFLGEWRGHRGGGEGGGVLGFVQGGGGGRIVTAGDE